jgi:hypothetical protein
MIHRCHGSDFDEQKRAFLKDVEVRLQADEGPGATLPD